MKTPLVNIALFASGSGSNAQKIMEYFDNSSEVNVALLLSNNKNAYALERAKNMNIQTLVFDRKTFFETKDVIRELQAKNINWVILAGFLWMIPTNLIKAFPDRIINIHPALLPSYGGKGMYGMHVHTAVHKAKEKETGISIHLVNEEYDEGEIIFQAKCSLDSMDTPESIAHKVLILEHKHFPEVIESAIRKSNKNT